MHISNIEDYTASRFATKPNTIHPSPYPPTPTSSPKTLDAITTHRGPVIETTHLIHASIVTPHGTTLYTLGNPNRLTLTRSAAKPIQTLAILETGLLSRYAFTPADIALMCASHSSEDRHISRARAMLSRSGSVESSLACGGHAALSPAVNRRWIKEDFEPSGVCNNCSGKHAGMIAGAVHLSCGGGSDGYHEEEHEMQRRVRKTVVEISGVGEEGVKWAVDGCNLPAPALGLSGFARMYARLGEAGDDEGVEDGETGGDERMRYLGMIFRAMTQFPEMVGGEGRFCTELMSVFGGDLVGKLGADGCYGVAVRARASGGRGPIGIAVKVEDGSIEMLYSAVVEILEQLGIGTMEMRAKLEAFHHLKISNTAGIVTGGVSHQFELRKVEE